MRLNEWNSKHIVIGRCVVHQISTGGLAIKMRAQAVKYELHVRGRSCEFFLRAMVKVSRHDYSSVFDDQTSMKGGARIESHHSGHVSVESDAKRPFASATVRCVFVRFGREGELNV